MSSLRYKAPGWPAIGLTAAIAIAVAAGLAFSDPVEVQVDGQPIVSDVPPVRTGSNAIFVPLRALSDAFGAETRYEPKSGQVTVWRGDQILRLTIGQTNATLNGMPMTLKTAPFRVRGRVMVGLRAVQRAFGVSVKFDKKYGRVEMRTPGMPQAPTEEAP